MRSWPGPLPVVVWLPTGLLVAAAALSHHRALASQLLARAVLWSNLILGSIIAIVGSGRERPIAWVLAATTAAALALLGRRGLDNQGRFVPVAFRRTLLALLVMALADAQTLIFFGALHAEFSELRVLPRTLPLLALAVALLAGVWGVFRLRVWGLLLHAAACAALAAATLGDAIAVPRELALALAATAAAQLVLAAPLALAVLRGAARAGVCSQGPR
jgi:hypothetical protein